MSVEMSVKICFRRDVNKDLINDISINVIIDVSTYITGGVSINMSIWEKPGRRGKVKKWVFTINKNIFLDHLTCSCLSGHDHVC